MPSPVVTSAQLAATVFDSVSYQVGATDSPTSWALVSGQLPPGLLLNIATGLITGMIQVTGVGQFAAVIAATNGSGTGTAEIAWTVNPVNSTLAIKNVPPALSPAGSFITRIVPVKPYDSTPVALLALPAPVLSAEVEETSIILTWDTVFQAASYNIYRGTVSGEETFLTNVTGLTYTDTGLSGTYYYKVQAYTVVVTSPLSNEVSGVAGATPPPGYVLWLDGQDPENGPYIDESAILHWPDKSGNNYDCFANFAGLTINEVGGFKYVGGWQNNNPTLLITPLISAYIAAGWAIYAVVIPTAVPMADSVLFSTGFTTYGLTYGDTIQVGTYLDGRARIAQGSSAEGFGVLASISPCTLNVPQLWRFRQGANGANLKIKVSGQAENTGIGVPAGEFQTPNQTFLGQTTVDSDALLALVAEYIMYPQEASDALDTEVAAYVTGKYPAVPA